MEEDNTLRRILSEIEESGISVSTLLVIQSYINSDSAVFLWDQLSSRRLPVSDLITPISSSMDSASSSLSLLASNVYLSLLLSPNAPLFSLFTPISFLSLLRSIRRSLKFRKEATSSRQNGGDRFDANLFFGVLEKLGCALALLHLVRFPDLFKSLVQVVAEIPVLGFDLCGNNTANRNKLFGFCAGIMKEVLRPEHGEQEMTAAEVLKSLTPLILSAKSQARTFALMFVRDEMIGLSKESSSVRKAVVNLPRYLAQKAPEKSAAEPILDVVKAMEFEDQVGFVDYVVKMAKGKSQLRYLAVDLIPKLLVSIQVVSGSELESEGVEDSWKSRCLVALVERCSDSVAGIRARALSSLAQLVRDASDDDRDSMLLKKALGFKDGQEGRVYNFLKKKCMDEKAAVRKAALFLITKLIALVGSSLDPEILKVMGITCSDPLVSIRKAAISALSEAFRIFSDRNVAIEWLHSVPRLINDSESSIQEECESLFMELVIDKVSRAGFAASTDSLVVQNSKSSPRSFQKELAALYPGVLDLLSEMCNGEVTPWVRKICSSLGKKGKLRPKIATALQNIIKTSEHLWLSQSMAIDNWTAPPGTWLLLSEVSSFLPKAVDWEFLYHHWKLLDKDVTTDELKSHAMEDIMHQSVDGMETNSAVWACDRVLLLQTISNVSVELSPEPAAQFAHDLLKRIEGFNMHSTEVNAHVKALKTLCKQKAMNPQEAEALVTKSVEQLFCKASHIVDMYLSSEEPTVSKENDLFTPPRSITIKGKRKATLSKLALQASTAVYTIGSLVIICPTLDLKTIIPVLHSMITSGTHEPRSNQLPGSRISVKEKAPGLYIQAWLTMGKICLADGKLAKRYIPLFVQELEKSDCAALRNNIIVIMADFCVRYTGLVDCYIAKITKCLRDSCELVRRQTFILLSRLLQTDYVKWRGVLFLRFLLSLDDESEKIRQLADFLFGNILKAKAPLLAYNSFVEAVFVLNDCQAYVTSNKSQNSRVERRLFSIRGNDENSRSRRMHIYVSLLKQMAPEHLLATFAKICAEILAAASDGILSIDEASGQSVLQDAFRVLTCKEIRLPASRAATSDAADMDEEVSGGAASAAAARGRVITQAVKKGLIQNTIPIFIELKRLLENKNSPLIGSLMECLRVLLKDYKNEIEDILVADKQLQKELIYDMQKYETVKAKSTATEAIATMHRSQEYHTPIAPDATIEKSKLSKKLHSDSKVASAMADVAAATVAKSVLKEVNKGAATPPLSLLNIPRLRTADRAGLSRGQKSVDVIESLRRRQTFDFNEEN